MAHICSNPNCSTPCNPSKLFCLPCWKLVPFSLQSKINFAYRKGINTGTHPTTEWLKLAYKARLLVASKTKKPMKQCKTCPWRISATVANIPNYSYEKHLDLAGTIAIPGDISQINQPIKIMACHQAEVGQEYACAGWLHNQLGNGNNIPLRIKAFQSPSEFAYEIQGKQKMSFEETFE